MLDNTQAKESENIETCSCRCDDARNDKHKVVRGTMVQTITSYFSLNWLKSKDGHNVLVKLTLDNMCKGESEITG